MLHVACGHGLVKVMQALVDGLKMDIMSRDFVSHNQHLAHYFMLHIHRLYVFDLLLYVCVCA